MAEGRSSRTRLATGRMIFQWFSLGPLRWVVLLLKKKKVIQWENNPILMHHLTIEGKQDASEHSPRGGTSKANLLE